MDNVTHSLVGWAIGQAGLKMKSRKGLAALILGANMPDIDVFFGWVPWTPLATHRGFTHSLIGGVLLLPPLLAGLLWLLDRWQVKRGVTFNSDLPMNVRWLVGLCYVGTLTHPLLDLQTSYAIQLFSPFTSRWFHTETLFILDVWIWTGLAFAIWLSRRREKRGGDWRRPASAALIGLTAYIALNGAISLQARRAALTEIGRPRPDVLIAGEQPVLFWRRNLIWRQAGTIGQAFYDPLTSIARIHDVAIPVPDNMADPFVQAAMHANPSLGSFLRWSILPVAQVATDHCRITVSFGDARFGVPAGSSRLGRTVTLKRPGKRCAGEQ